MKLLASTAVLFLVAVAPLAGQQPSAITLDKVPYEALGKAVLDNRGKVVLVDFWNSLCIPCIRSMPHLVEMQKKYGPEGFVIITVALDDPKENKYRETLETTLNAKGATFTNLWLDAAPEVWQKKLRFNGFPSTYVFDRDGKWTLFAAEPNAEPVNDEAIEKWVVELLKHK